MFFDKLNSVLYKRKRKGAFQQKRTYSKYSSEFLRFMFLGAVFIFGFLLVLWKLYQIQIVHHEEFQEKAYKTRNTSYAVHARRGSILMTDIKTGELAPVALNTTLYTVFFDARSGIDGNGHPYGADEKDFAIVAKELTDILYTKERYEECKKDVTKCPKGSVKNLYTNTEDTTTEEGQNSGEEGAREGSGEKKNIFSQITPLYITAKQKFEENLLADFLYKRETMIWATSVSNDILQNIESAQIPHLYVSFAKQQVYIDLIGLTDTNRASIAEKLQKQFGGKKEDISKKLYSKRRGYIPVMNRVYPEEVKKIKALQKEYYEIYTEDKKISPFESIGFEDDPVRYYPEGDLAAQVVGFADTKGIGQYGIERSMNTLLKGQDGILSASRDTSGNTIEDSQNNTKVIDGSDIILTVDRTLQKYAEKLLDQKVEQFKADSGQIIVMNPQNGDILVMANSPRFNPNLYGEVYERHQITKQDIKDKKIYKSQIIETKDENDNFVLSDYEALEKAIKRGGENEFYVYKNRLGPGAYVNKTIMEIFEPGSVMKPLMMAAAMQEGEITKDTTYLEKEPVQVGQFFIRNADNRYKGIQTMTNIIERSANVGMVFISRKMGKALMYQALKTYQFGEYTNIKLPEELSGGLAYWKDWSVAKQFTVSFGQGVSMTPLQVVRAWSALANGGYLVTPRIVSAVRHPDGSIEKFTPTKKRIFSFDMVQDMKEILISSTERGVAKNGRVKGFYIAGKTGTSQIIGKNGKYEDIEAKDAQGNTITGFIGYAPVKHPKYLIYVKFDRPRKAIRNLDVYGSTTSAPTFSELMAFILDYFNEELDK